MENGLYFNCTIQELKLRREKEACQSICYFNCTIQELKHGVELHKKGVRLSFQLHHTGIKTRRRNKYAWLAYEFQLHHTGIKTIELKSMSKEVNLISIAPYRN